MYKRMLRSVLAIGFSAVAIFGAVNALGGDAGRSDAPVAAIGKQDLGWDAPRPTDLGWDTHPAVTKTDLGWD